MNSNEKPRFKLLSEVFPILEKEIPSDLYADISYQIFF